MATRTKSGPVDLASLTPEPVEVVSSRRGRSSLIEQYPNLVASVKESWDTGQAFSYQLSTAEEAERVKALILLAGKKLGCGFSPSPRVTENNAVEFRAQDKRRYAGA